MGDDSHKGDDDALNPEQKRKLILLNDLSAQGDRRRREAAVRELAQDFEFVQAHSNLFELMLDDDSGFVRAAAIEAVQHIIVETYDPSTHLPLDKRRLSDIGKRVLLALDDEHCAVRKAVLRCLSFEPELLIAPCQLKLFQMLDNERSPEMQAEVLLALSTVPVRLQLPNHQARITAVLSTER